MKTNSIKMSATDSRETYEMLRAAHTLLRMAFGACATIYTPENEKESKSFIKKFDNLFVLISDAAKQFLELSESSEASDSKQVDN